MQTLTLKNVLLNVSLPHFWDQMVQLAMKVFMVNVVSCVFS